MNIGELILNLGIKGTDKTIGALQETEKGLKGLASTSLEAKVAIVGAMYALEHLFATSGKAGTNLVNFNSETGQSMKTLQQYQYAARQAGASNEEMAQSFEQVQSIMAKIQMNGGAPAGLARISELTGMTEGDIKKFGDRSDLFIQKLQEYAKKETNIGRRNEVLKQFVPGGIIPALTRQVFTQENFKKAPIYSDNEAKTLDKTRAEWSNLGTQIEMSVGHFNAKHGKELIDGISHIANQVLALVNAFTKLSEQLHIFDLIGKAFQGWSMILEGVSGAVDSITGAVKDPNNKKKAGQAVETIGKSDAGKFVSKTVGLISSSLFPDKGAMALAAAPNPVQFNRLQNHNPISKQSLAPSMTSKQSGNKTQNINNNISNTFQAPYEGAAKKTSHDIGKHIQNAARQWTNGAPQ